MHIFFISLERPSNAVPNANVGAFKNFDSLQFENKNQSKTLFLPFNYEFKVNETRKIDLYNRTILSLLILIFLIYTWKKESEKKGLDRKPNP